MTRQIILASTSPRRRELLKLLKVKFKTVDSGYVEVMHKHLAHNELVKFLALGKARAAAKKYPGAIIIAADTIVSLQGKAIGKPKTKQEAYRMIKTFSDKKTHYAISGAVVLDAKTGRLFSVADSVKIYFKKLSKREILNYVNSGEAFDKAGGYGPLGKGLNLIQKIQGDYTTAIGLPMGFVVSALCQLGIKV